MQKYGGIYELTVSALMAALMCVLAPMSVQIGPIPISLANLVIFLSSWLIGAKCAALSCIIYILLGAFGLPVFSGFQGGLAKLSGPTGGYIIGYVIMAFLGGISVERSGAHLLLSVIGIYAACLLDYAFGTVWYMFVTGSGMWAALSVCVLPFLPLDFLKVIAASFLGKKIRAAGIRAGIPGR